MPRAGYVYPILIVAVGIAAIVALALIASASGSDDDHTDPTHPDTTEGELSRFDDGFLAPFGTPGYRFDNPDVEIELVAAVTEWEVLPGEFIEVWSYNGQYPGPEIRVKEGQRVRVTLVNNLPQDTSIHWHGLDVPNAEDGVGNITQPVVPPGETWTYEFIPERVGTTAYHTHVQTLNQITRGLFGALIVEPENGESPYDHDRTMLLHEIGGLFTINGRSFPLTMERDLMSIKSGETMIVRFINMGGIHHPMHLHGHEFEILSIDGNTAVSGQFQNTVDVPPGQTVDVLVRADNPGTWVFHCHIIPHVSNRGEYPGGMIAVLDYSDNVSYFEAERQITFPDELGTPHEVDPPHEHGIEGTPEPTEAVTEEPTPTAVPSTPVPETPEPATEGPTEGTDDGDDAGTVITISSAALVFDQTELTAPANTEVTVVFENEDPAIPHNISFYEDDSAQEALVVGEIFSGIETREFTFTTPDAGTYFFRCDVHPTTMVGDFIVQ